MTKYSDVSLPAALDTNKLWDHRGGTCIPMGISELSHSLPGRDMNMWGKIDDELSSLKACVYPIIPHCEL